MIASFFLDAEFRSIAIKFDAPKYAMSELALDGTKSKK